MTDIKNTTQKALGIIADWNRATSRAAKSIFEAYGKPSSAKINAYFEIKKRAEETAGYNKDLTICGAGSHYFSTIYSYSEDGKTYIVKDTAANTYRVQAN